jgi:hypothetical protein
MAWLDRQSLLQYKEKSQTNRVPLVTTYRPVLKDLGSILRKHLPILHTNERIADVFKGPSHGILQLSQKFEGHGGKSQAG